MNTKIGIIGAGNMGGAIAIGLNKAGYKNIETTTIDINKSKHLSDIGIKVHANNAELVKNSDVVVLAIKPFQIKSILTELKGLFNANQTVISVVTGFSLSQIHNLIGVDAPIYRVMPNTAIAIQESMSCIAGLNTSSESDQLMKQMFDELGETVFIDESQMNAATVLAASGTAFALRFISAATKAGVETGFKADIAQKIASQMVKGAAVMGLSGKHTEEEIDRVTTPNGCTIVGLNTMEHNGFSSSVIQGIVAGTEKVKKMAKENE